MTIHDDDDDDDEYHDVGAHGEFYINDTGVCNITNSFAVSF